MKMNRTLKKILLLLTLTIFANGLIAQYGVSAIYNSQLGADDWDIFVNDGDHIKSNGFGLSVDYWFRLKNYRVEFSPEIGFLKGDHSLLLTSGDNPSLSWSQLFVLANVNIYPFDIEGDCNCPTLWKKDVQIRFSCLLALDWI
jgi:hypothetical protein